MKVHLLPLGKKRSVQSSGTNKTNVVDWSLEPSLSKIILLREQSKPRSPSHSVRVTKDFQFIVKTFALKGKSITRSKIDHFSCLKPLKSHCFECKWWL